MTADKQEINGWFIPRQVPFGSAPERIKEQWVGVPLPIRYDRSTEEPEMQFGQDVSDGEILTILEDGVDIQYDDAIKALRLFEKDEAAQWWTEYFGGRTGGLLFAIEEVDEIVPTSYLRLIMPGIEEFDQIEV